MTEGQKWAVALMLAFVFGFPVAVRGAAALGEWLERSGGKRQ